MRLFFRRHHQTGADLLGFLVVLVLLAGTKTLVDYSQPAVVAAFSTTTGPFARQHHHVPLQRPAPSWLLAKNYQTWHLQSKGNENGDDATQATSSSSSTTDVAAVFSSPIRTLVFSLLMTLSGAILGPFLDAYHSSFGVLQYDQPITATLWGSFPDHPALITAWWVPELFGLAGFIIGWLYILLDQALVQDRPAASTSPTPPKILLGISLFTLQYWLSGVLYQSGMVDRTAILSIMSVVAAAGFLLLDGSLAGLIVSAATAIGGPLIEVGLLTLSATGGMLAGTGYHYTDPGETGFFPLWIVPVYFLGGPAVGNLARGIWNGLSHRAALDDRLDDRVDGATTTATTTRAAAGCTVCNDTRRVSCPNCDGVGSYVATGGRSVTCTSCRGRGFVICRDCFSYYDEDPNDIEAIRKVLSRMPD